jgi:hypothetical protein
LHYFDIAIGKGRRNIYKPSSLISGSILFTMIFS